MNPIVDSSLGWRLFSKSLAMTSDEMIVQILLGACHLLEERGWNRGSMARDANGDTCGLDSKDAVSYCLSGALVKSWRDHDRANEDFYFRLFERQFSEVILKKYNHRYTLTRWNDDIATCREAVVELIHAVIKSIRSDSSQSFKANESADGRQRSDERTRSRFRLPGRVKSKQKANYGVTVMASWLSARLDAILRHGLRRVQPSSPPAGGATPMENSRRRASSRRSFFLPRFA
jgi:hypothetical protein